MVACDDEENPRLAYDEKFYLKSEADRAIIEKDNEIEEIKANLDKAIAERDGNQVCIDALKQKLENVNELVKESK